MPSFIVELLFVLFEMTNCTSLVVSSISAVERFLIVWSLCVCCFDCAIWSNVCALYIKGFCFVCVSDGSLCFKAVASVLLCK